MKNQPSCESAGDTLLIEIANRFELGICERRVGRATRGNFPIGGAHRFHRPLDAREIEHWADPFLRQPGKINAEHGGRDAEHKTDDLRGESDGGADDERGALRT